MTRGQMHPLRSDDEEIAVFNRCLLYRKDQGVITAMVKVDRHRFPSHYSFKGPLVSMSPEFKAVLDRNSLKALR